MAPTVTVDKISEEYRDYILTSGFLCTINNYVKFINARNRRQCMQNTVLVTEDVIADLFIYPTGISPKFDGYISIYLSAAWKKSKSIVMKFDTAVLDRDCKKVFLNSSENFERLPAHSLIGDSEIMHSDVLFDRKFEFLNQGSISILLNISINFEMMMHPDMLDRFENEHQMLVTVLKRAFDDPRFGNCILLIGAKKYHVHRDILIRGNPMFTNMFQEQPDANGYHSLNDLRFDVMEHILLDCYLNGGADRNFGKRSKSKGG